MVIQSAHCTVLVQMGMSINSYDNNFYISSEEVKESAFFVTTNWDDVLGRKVCDV